MPSLRVDVEAVGCNAEAVARLLDPHGIRLVGVTKACLGDPRVGAEMLAGGAVALADTRDDNLLRLRLALPGVELHRIYLPSLAHRFEPGDITYISSWEGAVATACLGREGGGSRPRRVMVQVETGDMREGVPQEHLEGLTLKVAQEPRLELCGLATNYACFQGTPDGIRSSVSALSEAARRLRAQGLPVSRVSGGSSSLLWLLAGGERLPAEVSEVRCGEALLLGQDALHYEALPGCRRDGCILRAEVVEEYTKPVGERGRSRVVLALGRQDLGCGLVEFVGEGLSELGRSTDYMVVGREKEARRISVGDTIEMIPSYQALAAAWASPYVRLELC